MLINVTLRQMQGFLMVARLGSFSRAANEMGMSQSALSQAIAQLEFLLDAKLLERTRRSVTLTPAGTKFLRRIERILSDVGSAIAELREEATMQDGKVAVACLSTVATGILPPAIRAFKRSYPRVSVTIRDDHVDGITEQVKARTVDFAVTCLFTDDPAVDFEPLIADRFRFVCRRDHPLAGRKVMRWQDLKHADFVAMTRGSGVRTLLERALSDHRVFDHALYEVSRVPSVLSIVEEGEGVSVLPALTLARPGADATLFHCPMVEPEVPRLVGIMTLRGTALSTVAAALRRAIIDSLEASMIDRYPDVRLVSPRRCRTRARAS